MKDSPCQSCGQLKQRFVDIKDASEYLGLTPSALRSMVARREIDFFKLGNRIRFDIVALKKAVIPYPSVYHSLK